MRNFLQIVFGGIVMFIIVVGVILLIALGLHYVLEYIPCEILVYIETGILLGIFMLVISLLLKGKVKSLFNE